MEERLVYAEALRARNRDIVTVCLATGIQVTVPKVPVNLGVNYLDFDSVERCSVVDLEARYDLILGTTWLERHEPWIDWRSKLLGATHFSPGGELASREPTSARKQKRFWCENWAEESSLDAHEGMVSSEPRHHVCGSDDACGVAQDPLSDDHSDGELSLDA
ncbi:unnamed protein product [Phytophthora fragariaefolia]|uniref:Unnamed protein product n=1 Tax=Phytophthora fragariaefolia TaxID=1490495 RepID=A0A9W6Y874_9STRA|nr:unnamed protein product [Phytophthora fragariaefolia]